MRTDSQKLIGIDQAETVYSVNKIEIIKDALIEKIDLFRLSPKGEWRKINKTTLEFFVRNRFTKKRIDGPAGPFINGHLDLTFDQIFANPQELKKLYADIFKSLEDEQTIGDLLSLASEAELPDNIATSDARSLRRSINTLKDKYPAAISLCIRIMLESTYVVGNEVRWKKYSREEIEVMAKNDNLSKVIGREIHKSLPRIMKKK